MTAPLREPTPPSVPSSPESLPPMPPQVGKRNPPLTEAFRVQVITTYYAPALMGTSFAASLVQVAEADEAAVHTTEWHAAAQEAEDVIRQGCAALRGMPSPGTQIPYVRALKSAEKLEKFIVLWHQFLQDGDLKKLETASKTLKQGQDLLARAGESFLTPRKRSARAKR